MVDVEPLGGLLVLGAVDSGELAGGALLGHLGGSGIEVELRLLVGAVPGGLEHDDDRGCGLQKNGQSSRL